MSPHTPHSRYWKTVRADRLTVIVDAADYFRAAKEALLQARHSVLLLGWDFDARIALEPQGKTLDGPNQIGPFLNWLARTRKDLDIRVLKWDLGMMSTIARGETPFFLVQWLFGRRVKLKLDHAHPPLSAHHTKLLVIDDALAFCGGIDITTGRWDTPAHDEGDPARRSPRGKPLDPWHDATTCVTGPAAAALGELARHRWERAAKERLAPPPREAVDVWPPSLSANFTDIDVEIARTLPALDDAPQVSEIEEATLDIIAGARRTLYIESQYFACRRIAQAIATRLGEPEGPDVVVINPHTADGWLEVKTMDSARVILMGLMARADVHDRFRLLYPVNAAGTPIYVHAKIVIADDDVLKVGSANLNNRSMGFDSECDIVIRAQDERTRDGIRTLRARLLAEHLGAEPDAVEAAIGPQGRLCRTVDALMGEGRSLRPVPRRELSAAEVTFAETDMVDPERPPSAREVVRSIFQSAKSSR